MSHKVTDSDVSSCSAITDIRIPERIVVSIHSEPFCLSRIIQPPRSSNNVPSEARRLDDHIIVTFTEDGGFDTSRESGVSDAEVCWPASLIDKAQDENGV
ncbi:unnamed protein product [Cyclocybe aegerita]|uniref:Uncharacterized protein n=1 Tax=Cyclocybe aegerita TaxID=1973307 RepID=A0A8S0VXE4_CYCAE|nr:unnamed protein product [Cyclocybe aegerita]